VQLAFLDETNGDVLLSAKAPPGAFDEVVGSGWTMRKIKGKASGTKWKYTNRNAASGGIAKLLIVVKDAAGTCTSGQGTYPISTFKMTVKIQNKLGTITADKPMTSLFAMGQAQGLKSANPCIGPVGGCFENRFFCKALNNGSGLNCRGW
jgi:hypothetical protein